MINTSTPWAITWTPLQLATVVTSADCDCSQPTATRYWYNFTERSNNPNLGACVLFCDPPAFPYLLGTRPAECLTLGFCQAFTGVEITNLAGLRNVLSSGQPGTVSGSEMVTSLGFTAIDNSATDALAGYLLASALILDYLARYVPETTIFLRTLSDPLFSTTKCINDTVLARPLYSGEDMGIVVKVLTDVYYGDIAVNYDCNSHYYDNTTYWAFCNKLYGQVNASMPTVSTAAYNAFTLTYVLPLLQSFTNFMPQGNISLSNQCFEVATVLTSGQLVDLGSNLGVCTLRHL